MALAAGVSRLKKTAPTGLAAFTRKPPPPSAAAPPEESVTGKRTRGKNDVVALTVRLRRADWERLHQFAVTEGVSLQQLAHDGFSRLLVEKGLPGLN